MKPGVHLRTRREDAAGERVQARHVQLSVEDMLDIRKAGIWKWL